MTDTDLDESISELSSLINCPTMQHETSSLSGQSTTELTRPSAQTISTEVEVTDKVMSGDESTENPSTAEAAETSGVVPTTSEDVEVGTVENMKECEESATAENVVANGNSLDVPEDTVSRISSVEGDMCRICHSVADDSESLISPCNCCGSMKWVHQRCLQTWVKSRDAKKCELCGYLFNMTSSVKPLRKWKKMDMPSVERRRLLCQVTFHIVAITCVIWSLYVLIDRTTQELQEGQLNWPFWTKLVVVAVGFTGGLVFMYVQCKTYVKLFRRWKQFNRVIYINDARVLGVENSTENTESNQTVVVDMSNVSGTINRAAGEQHTVNNKQLQANPA